MAIIFKLPGVIGVVLWIIGFSTTCFSADKVYRCQSGEWGVVFQQSPCADSSVEPIELNPQVVDWIESPETGQSTEKEGSARKRTRPKARPGKRTATEQQCWRNRQKLERIQWKLRKGYKPAEGERLKQKCQELEAYARKFCP
ncbi:hypothetical protein [Solemya velesiana gill symbiont]|uniref:DUF4124 domain-containing protein n=1 Tax=Solemya velesiana gill symbiont TaxID=1918948 RepID=A0A1T2KWK3_9GAMM|nr:hypothetical protein [Solemya velesiana gill symbiont]OOZ37126.1 hypothetical protein BOW51_03850 [Solemya velesiana gill symbiont]